MALNRQEIENKILNILTYLEQNTLAFPLKQNINLFSLKELEQLLEFLESWKLEPIYNFLDEKYKEYMWLIEELKTINISKKVNIKKQEEENERNKEAKELELLINF